MELRLKEAIKLGEELIAIMQPFCDDIHLVGSVANGKANPSDIDIAYSTKRESEMIKVLDAVVIQKSLLPKWIIFYKGTTVDLFRIK